MSYGHWIQRHIFFPDRPRLGIGLVSRTSETSPIRRDGVLSLLSNDEEKSFSLIELMTIFAVIGPSATIAILHLL